jgi:hypothetical protein
LKEFFKKENIQQDASNTHTSNDIEGVHQAVRKRLGLGMLLDIPIEEEIKRGEIISLFSEKRLPRKNYI